MANTKTVNISSETHAEAVELTVKKGVLLWKWADTAIKEKIEKEKKKKVN